MAHQGEWPPLCESHAALLNVSSVDIKELRDDRLRHGGTFFGPFWVLAAVIFLKESRLYLIKSQSLIFWGKGRTLRSKSCSPRHLVQFLFFVRTTRWARSCQLNEIVIACRLLEWIVFILRLIVLLLSSLADGHDAFWKQSSPFCFRLHRVLVTFAFSITAEFKLEVYVVIWMKFFLLSRILDFLLVLVFFTHWSDLLGY